MPFSVKVLHALDKLEPDLKSILFDVLAEIEQSQERTTTRAEFSEFAQDTNENQQKVWQAIGQLTESQKRTEKRMDDLVAAQVRTEKRVDDLVAAQVRTEKRMDDLVAAQVRTEKRMDDLVAAQVRTEKRVDDLVAAQARTEQRLEQLTEAQKRLTEAQERTEQRISELASAQVQTEQRLEQLAEGLQKLTRRVDDLSVQLGGLSNTIGYGLEDMSYTALKSIIKRDFDVDVERLIRKNIVYSSDNFDEVNIYGETVKDGEPLYIIGECKAQFGSRDVTKYNGLLARLREHLNARILPLTLAYHYHPKAEEQLSALSIRYYWSYEILEG